MFKSYRSLVPLAALCALAACEETPTQPDPIVIPGPNEPVVYSKHIEPIFQRSCAGAGCHIGGEKMQGLALDTWNDVMAGSEFTSVVIPYSGEKSHLLQHINTDTMLAPIARPLMPFGRDPLPMEQIRLIKRWIDEGAKNDAGDVALAGDRPRVFVTNQSEDKVTAIDLETMRIARYIDVGIVAGSVSPEAPHNIILSPDRKYLYINLIATGRIEKYDARTFEKLGGTSVGLSPAQIAITRDGSTLYVSNFDLTGQQRFINRVDAASMTVTETIKDVGVAPHGVTLSADERTLYTTNALGDNVSEIELSSGDIVRRIPIAPGVPPVLLGPPEYEPYQSVLGPDGRTLWVTCRKHADVRVIDLDLGKVVDSIPVGQRPLILAMTPDNRELWIPNQASDNISIIDVAARTVIATIPAIKSQPHAVAFTADGKTAFVTCENVTGGGNLHHPIEGNSRVPGIVYVIDVATRAVVHQIEVGGFAAGVAL